MHQHRDEIRKCFAGASLRNSKDISALQSAWNRLTLYRCWFRDILRPQLLHDPWVNNFLKQMAELFDWTRYELALDIDFEFFPNAVDLIWCHCFYFRMLDEEILYERFVLDFRVVNSFKCGNPVFLFKLPQFIKVYLTI